MPRMLRIRYIPYETVDLSSDQLIYSDHKYLITKWRPIKPRNDIASGVSCVFLENGWKVSAVMDGDNEIKYWYCDIIDIEYDKDADTYYLYDLLMDIRILPDGKVEVIDLDELAVAFDEGLITKDQVSAALTRSNSLLKLAYTLDFPAHVLKMICEHTGWECKTWQQI